MLSKTLNDLVIQAKTMMQQTHNITELNIIRVKFLGKKGYITQQIKMLNHIPIKNRAKLGTIINQAKNDINLFYIKRQNILQSKNIENYTIKNTLDITLPGRYLSELGNIHPITHIIKNIKCFFNALGFSTIHGPEIEDDYFNFQALNMPIDHPARDEHDTFWLDKKNLLRTHTSGIQIRFVRHKTPPIRIISFGRVYRKDYDKNHTPMFHQMEGIIIDTHINFSNLKKILYDFLYYFFENNINIRFRPSYFPFTEPSAEIDAIIKQKKTSNNWLELLGCGMIHPKILQNIGINPKKFSGFAFGIGIERLAMLLYDIKDIRIFFKNDLSFLKQFK